MVDWEARARREALEQDAFAALRILEDLPLLVRETRERKGLSLREAEREVGIGFATLSRYENDVTTPDTASLMKLLRWATT